MSINVKIDMDLKSIIGELVKNKQGKIGKIIDINEYILIQLDDKKLNYQITAFLDGFLVFIDNDLQRQIEKQIEYNKIKKLIKFNSTENKSEINIKYKRILTEKSIQSKFDRDYHAEFLRIPPPITYQDIETRFKISLVPFGKGINLSGDYIILISRIQNSSQHFVYHDKWDENGDFIYSGQGQLGDHKWIKPNLAIKNSIEENKKIILFIKFSSQEYYYQGKFSYVNYTIENNKDANGDIRNQIKFRIRPVTD